MKQEALIAWTSLYIGVGMMALICAVLATHAPNGAPESSGHPEALAALAAQLPQGRARYPGNQRVLCLARRFLSVLGRLIVHRMRQAVPCETDWAREVLPKSATRRRSNSECQLSP